MKTECPHCHTLFRMTEAQLDMAGGMVRCGYCNTVFNALRADDFSENDRQLDVFDDTPGASRQATGNNNARQAYARDRADLPERTATETVAPIHDYEPVGGFADEPGTEAPARFHPRASGRHSTWSTPLWSAAILLLIAGLVSEYAWFNREQLLNQRELQPFMAALCEYVRCDGHISLHDPDSIEMFSRNVYTHPNEKNALMITATIINHADYAQALPDVQIDFSSTRGEVVASRRFKPAEYMQPDHDGLNPMQPGVPVSFSLEIVDPGKDAITYEFMFL